MRLMAEIKNLGLRTLWIFGIFEQWSFPSMGAESAVYSYALISTLPVSISYKP